MLLVLAMALSLGGAVVLAGNFDDALNEAGQQAEVQHLLQCYALESDLLDVAARGETVTDSHLARYGSSLEDYVGGKLVALYRGDAAAQGGTSSAAAETETEAQAASDAERQPAALRTVYTSFPWDEGPTGQTDTYRMHRDGGRTYMLFEAEVETVGNPPVTLLTGHDVTSVFAARDRALLRFWEMELVVLVCAGAMIALPSRWLTKPLARLTQASESIAGGAYGERTGLSGGDEIGVLSRSFDAMAAAVQEKVDALELSVRQREDFMSAFTHELKTPMTAVIGYADTLRSMQCEPSSSSGRRTIFSEARRVEALSKVAQLLGLRERRPRWSRWNRSACSHAPGRRWGRPLRRWSRCSSPRRACGCGATPICWWTCFTILCRTRPVPGPRTAACPSAGTRRRKARAWT
ncbi:MAG: HAMP domain-containing protein [Ruthenibacterium lactatiformans]